MKYPRNGRRALTRSFSSQENVGGWCFGVLMLVLKN